MKQGKRIVSLILALVMICGLMINASAAEVQEIKAQLSYDITVSYNGEAQTLTDAAGNIVYPISYNGTTYLPVRAVSYVLGIAVDWDGATQTVLLSDGEAAAPEAIPTADAPSGSKDITAQLNPGITVKYNGEVQTMTDATGNTVYPVSYESTTYLPVRAVSNMLGVEVDWDGATQTVLLNKPQVETGTSIQIGTNDPDEMRSMLMVMVMTGTVDANLNVEEAVAALTTTGIYVVDGVTFKCGEIDEPDSLDELGYKTSTDAEILGEKHIGYDWAEIDWSTANDGYVRAKWTQNLVEHGNCRLAWIENDKLYIVNMQMPVNEWITVPLPAGSRDYGVVVEMLYTDEDLSNNKTDEELDAIYRFYLSAQFSAELTDPDAWMLMSSVKSDYKNAPNACEKALELTKNCKTDAEKITAIFNYVATNIKYDTTLYNWEKANEERIPAENERDLNPDHIMESKKGVCEHYASLMTAMLRSIGVPCKMVYGSIRHSDGEWEGHAWVAVKPATGTLNKSALGAGMEPDGEWIRLDPTWGNTSSGRAAAAKDEDHRTDYYY